VKVQGNTDETIKSVQMKWPHCGRKRVRAKGASFAKDTWQIMGVGQHTAEGSKCCIVVEEELARQLPKRTVINPTTMWHKVELAQLQEKLKHQAVSCHLQAQEANDGGDKELDCSASIVTPMHVLPTKNCPACAGQRASIRVGGCWIAHHPVSSWSFLFDDLI
jgi:hypothetical protein